MEAPAVGPAAYRMDERGRLIVPKECLEYLGEEFIATRAPGGKGLLMWRTADWEGRLLRCPDADYWRLAAKQVLVHRVTKRIALPCELRVLASIRPGTEVAWISMGDAIWVTPYQGYQERLLGWDGVFLKRVIAEVMQCR